MQVIVRHTEEVRTLREQLKRQKNKTAQAEKKHRDASEELSMAQRKLKKAQSVINEKGLGERHDLARKLTKFEKDREEKEKRVNVSRKKKKILWVLAFFFIMWANILRKSFNTFRIFIVGGKMGSKREDKNKWYWLWFVENISRVTLGICLGLQLFWQRKSVFIISGKQQNYLMKCQLCSVNLILFNCVIFWSRLWTQDVAYL